MTSFRLRWYPRAILVVVTVVVVAAALRWDAPPTPERHLGGDLPSFYAAGRLVAEGEGVRLYDLERQEEVQAPLLGEGVLPFVYPPFVALAYAPLAGLDYRLAYVAHLLGMALLLWGAVRLARPLVPRLLRSRDHELAAFAALVGFGPLARALLGGQNTPLTLFLLAACWRALHDRRDLLAGVVAAGLLYKPQFGLPVVLLLIVARRRSAIAGWAAGAVVLYWLGALVTGPDWPLAWVEAVSAFGPANVVANGPLMIAPAGVLQVLLGPGAVAALVGAALVAVAVSPPVLARWWREGPSAPRRATMGLSVPWLLLVAPSALYYDAGLLVVSAGTSLATPGRRTAVWVAAAWVASWSQPLADRLGLSPLILLVVAFGVATWRVGRGEAGDVSGLHSTAAP